MKSLNNLELIESIKNESERNKKIVGICVGMQILCEKGIEGEPTNGLSLMEGYIERLPIIPKHTIPNINWHQLISNQSDINQNEIVYFLHSYYMNTEKSNIVSYIYYGELKIPAVVNKKNIWGIQFHPEKSGKDGLNLLKNILNE